MAKYFHIGFHDNDFRSEFEYVAENLYVMFQMEDCYPTEDDFYALKYIISRMAYSFYLSTNLLRWREFEVTAEGEKHYLEYFTPSLDFVEFEDIPDWDNSESAYIPMFDDSVIIMR